MTAEAFRQHELNCMLWPTTCSFCQLSVTRKALPVHQKSGSCAKCKTTLESICLMQQHETTCPAVPVPCASCKLDVLRGAMGTHLAQSCPEALIECAHCRAAFARKLDHICPVPCALGCQETVRGDHMAEHWRTNCAKYVRKCPESACFFQAPREGLSEHNCPVTEAKLIFAPGAQCDVRDHAGYWYAATMLHVAPKDVTVHFEYWSTTFDEVVSRDAPRFAPLRRLSQYGPWVGREVRVRGEHGWKKARIEKVHGATVHVRDSNGKDSQFMWNEYGEVNLWHMLGVFDESDLVPGMLVSGCVEGCSCATLLIVQHTATHLTLRDIDCALALDQSHVDYCLPRAEALQKLSPLHAMK
jgi:hypothetical protein